MAKPMLVTLPLVLLLLDVWPLGRLAPPDRRRTAAAAAPVALLAGRREAPVPAGLAALAYLPRPHPVAARDPSACRRPVCRLRLANALAVSVLRYLGTLILPADLALFHPFPSSVPLAPALLAAAALALVTLAFARLWRRVPAVVAGWLWFLVTLLPVLGLVQAGLWPAMADRFAYLPLVGLAVAIVWGVTAAARLVPRTRVAGVLVCATALVLFAARTRRQIEVWGDSVTLLETAVAAAPQAAALRANLAGTYLQNGEIEKAIAGYRHALRLDPRHTVAYVGLARAYATSGRPGPARDTLEALGRARPGPTAHVELGNLALAGGQLDGAAREYAAAVALDPGHAGARFNLAQVLQRQSRTDAARRELRAVLELDSSFRAAHLALADLELAAGDREAALRSLEDARRLGLPDASLLLRLGTAYGEAGRIDRAVARLQEAVGLEPANSEAHNNLGTAYWLSGSLDAAARQYELAARLEPANARAQFNLSLAISPAGPRRRGRRCAAPCGAARTVVRRERRPADAAGSMSATVASVVADVSSARGGRAPSLDG